VPMVVELAETPRNKKSARFNLADFLSLHSYEYS
jgi:hypothetical protein